MTTLVTIDPSFAYALAATKPLPSHTFAGLLIHRSGLAATNGSLAVLRLASFEVESTRFVSYGSDVSLLKLRAKDADGIEVDDEHAVGVEWGTEAALATYFTYGDLLREQGAAPWQRSAASRQIRAEGYPDFDQALALKALSAVRDRIVHMGVVNGRFVVAGEHDHAVLAPLSRRTV